MEPAGEPTVPCVPDHGKTMDSGTAAEQLVRLLQQLLANTVQPSRRGTSTVAANEEGPANAPGLQDAHAEETWRDSPQALALIEKLKRAIGSKVINVSLLGGELQWTDHYKTMFGPLKRFLERFPDVFEVTMPAKQVFAVNLRERPPPRAPGGAHIIGLAPPGREGGPAGRDNGGPLVDTCQRDGVYNTNADNRDGSSYESGVGTASVYSDSRIGALPRSYVSFGPAGSLPSGSDSSYFMGADGPSTIGIPRDHSDLPLFIPFPSFFASTNPLADASEGHPGTSAPDASVSIASNACRSDFKPNAGVPVAAETTSCCFPADSPSPTTNLLPSDSCLGDGGVSGASGVRNAPFSGGQAALDSINRRNDDGVTDLLPPPPVTIDLSLEKWLSFDASWRPVFHAMDRAPPLPAGDGPINAKLLQEEAGSASMPCHARPTGTVEACVADPVSASCGIERGPRTGQSDPSSQGRALAEQGLEGSRRCDGGLDAEGACLGSSATVAGAAQQRSSGCKGKSSGGGVVLPEEEEEDPLDELQSLLQVMPPAVTAAIRSHPRASELVEVVLDVGRRPYCRFSPLADAIPGQARGANGTQASSWPWDIHTRGGGEGCLPGGCGEGGLILSQGGKGGGEMEGCAGIDASSLTRRKAGEIIGRKDGAARKGLRDDVEELASATLTLDDLAACQERVGAFGADNRAILERSLHRISRLVDRQGRVVGLTARVGRAVTGITYPLMDLLARHQSMLIVGPPGCGKTTVLRDVARVLADVHGRRVMIVDSDNEIGGDGAIPHPGVGSSRRIQVPVHSRQAAVMVEAVKNHMPEVIVIDEIATEEEAAAARTLAQR
eukprot:jgi/Mesvir1/17168/Mv07590-RA.2